VLFLGVCQSKKTKNIMLLPQFITKSFAYGLHSLQCSVEPQFLEKRLDPVCSIDVWRLAVLIGFSPSTFRIGKIRAGLALNI
jgi:hypothetical protein